jgi:hypothetical protein
MCFAAHHTATKEPRVTNDTDKDKDAPATETGSADDPEETEETPEEESKESFPASDPPAW